MHKLQLQATPGAWRLYAGRKADPAFKKFQLKVFARDNYTCQFCGFQAKEFQEVVNLDSNYSNNKFSNLVTACCFCSQCLFLESVGIGDYGGGSLVYLPELSQEQLNSLCHVLFCAITNDTGYKATAQSIYRSFKFRSQIIEDKYGEGTSNPSIFGQLLIDSDHDIKKVNEQIFKNVCLLPSRAKFRPQIERWAASALAELSGE